MTQRENVEAADVEAGAYPMIDKTIIRRCVESTSNVPDRRGRFVYKIDDILKFDTDSIWIRCAIFLTRKMSRKRQ